MTFTPLMQQVVKELDFTSVCEFGNQRFRGIDKKNFASTKAYYASLGCEDYVALDVNEDKDAIIADLNRPVTLDRTFDLVTNNGTGEHIFNQHAVFENAHNLSHKFMLHCLPMLPWVNHGFFNYTPVLFRDLAHANGYGAQVYIANRWGDKATMPDEELYREKHPKILEKATQKLSVRGGVFVVAIFEKTNDTSSTFQTPFQGKYQSDIQDEGLRNQYA